MRLTYPMVDTLYDKNAHVVIRRAKKSCTEYLVITIPFTKVPDSIRKAFNFLTTDKDYLEAVAASG